MARRRVLAIIGAAVLTLIGTVILLTYVTRAEDRALEGTRLLDVLVATEPIEAGVAPTDMLDVVRVQSIPADLRQEDAVSDLADPALNGMVTVGPVLAGQQIVERQFGASQRAGATGQIPDDKQIVTIALESQRAVGGNLQVGDLVGVIVTLGGAGGSNDDPNTPAVDDQTGGDGDTTGMVLNGIPIRALRGAATDEGGGTGNVMVSLEVDEPDAEVIVFAQENGSVWLTHQPEAVPNRPDDDVQTGGTDMFRGPRGS